MIAVLIVSLTFLAALGSALMAGTFFAFSNFVMPALGKLPSEQGLAAMQSINRVVINPLFITVFMGTTIVTVVLSLATIFAWRGTSSLLIVLGSLCYVLGTFGVTVVFNIPLNNGLETAVARSSEAAQFWRRYLSEWVFWNSVRTLFPLIGVGLFMASFIVRN